MTPWVRRGGKGEVGCDGQVSIVSSSNFKIHTATNARFPQRSAFMHFMGHFPQTTVCVLACICFEQSTFSICRLVAKVTHNFTVDISYALNYQLYVKPIVAMKDSKC